VAAGVWSGVHPLPLSTQNGFCIGVEVRPMQMEFLMDKWVLDNRDLPGNPMSAVSNLA
jgi:hypothetical protein